MNLTELLPDWLKWLNKVDIFDYIHKVDDKFYLYPKDVFKKEYSCDQNKIRWVTYLRYGEIRPVEPYKNVIENCGESVNTLILDLNDEFWYDILMRGEERNGHLIHYFHKWRKIVREEKINNILI